MMNAYSSFGSRSFHLVAKGLVELHRLIKIGKDETPDAESVRDALDSPLKALSPTEKERARWLSEDLYSVSEPTQSVVKGMNSQVQQQLTEAFESRKKGEWYRALDLLRECKEYISPAHLSYLRGSIWAEMGNPDVAAMFFGHASESDPEHANYRANYLRALAESDPDDARKLARDILADDENQAPVLVAQAANIRLQETKTTLKAESYQLYRKLIPILDRNKARLEKDEGNAFQNLAYLMTVSLLGFCYEDLGDAGAAVNSYSLGLKVDPNNDGLLVARGILQYGTSPIMAISDFDQAVKLNSSVVWPYLYLSHHYLITTGFDECRIMCELGLRMQGSDAAKSRLQEWRAIAQAELGFPPELVRSAFEAAVRLDPSNDFARRNQIAFEASLKDPHRGFHLKWEQMSDLAIRQIGLVERRYDLPPAA
jgi:tetratricopeptide (TPR) repeat protein